MNKFSLVSLFEIGGEKNLFLVPSSFTKFAFDLPLKFAPTPMKKITNEMSVKIPENIRQEFAPLLTSHLPNTINITSGSCENDAYISIMDNLEVFDEYGDLMEYALNNGWEVDETNGFDGMIY